MKVHHAFFLHHGVTRNYDECDGNVVDNDYDDEDGIGVYYELIERAAQSEEGQGAGRTLQHAVWLSLTVGMMRIFGTSYFYICCYFIC